MNKYMQKAYEISMKNSENNFQDGGPFGAVIVKDGEVIAATSNSVLSSNDPTAHAEVNAIREACRVLNTSDLSGCELYTSCYPCPMCLSAIVWANITEVYYGNTKEDAGEIGFRDAYLYEALKDIEKFEDIKLSQIDREYTIEAFEEFKKKPNLY